ncbi:MAG: GIY-YIG nuclease family protein [Candidatus Omnitrophica bacterium]|nr:GIY-YIG nuclease family protein [Candidatus Omnitrophota bacterium]
MYFVYVLKSEQRNYIYVGLTNDLERRIKQHQEGKSSTTRSYRPFVLVLTEKSELRLEARNREKYLKSGSGKEWIKLQIK